MEEGFKEMSHVETVKKDEPLTNVVAHNAGKGFGKIMQETFERVFIFIYLILLTFFIGVIMMTVKIIDKLSFFGMLILFCVYFVTVNLPFAILLNGDGEKWLGVSMDFIHNATPIFFVGLGAVIILFALATERGRDLFGRAWIGLVLGANVEEGGVDNEKN